MKLSQTARDRGHRLREHRGLQQYCRRRSSRIVLLIGLLVRLPGIAAAQFETGVADITELRGLPSDRRTIAAWQALQQATAGDRPGDAADKLQQLVAADSASMIPFAAPDTAFRPLLRAPFDADPDVVTPVAEPYGSFRPLYRALFDAMFEIPQAARERLIRSLPGSDRALLRALEDASPELLPVLIQRFPGTEASLQAHLILARLHLDRGNTMAAVIWLQGLTNPEMPQPYRRAAGERLRQLLPEVLPQPEVNFVAGSSRLPQHIRWVCKDISSGRLDREINEFTETCRQSHLMPQTTWRAEVRDGVLYRRSPLGVMAVDADSGNVLWHSRQNPDVSAIDGNKRTSGFPALPRQLMTLSVADQSPIANTFCRDNVFSHVVTDERRVYLLTTDDAADDVVRSPMVIRSTGTVRFTGNRVVALDRKTGRRLWTLGENAFDELEGTGDGPCWIDCRPVPHQGSLYLTVERDAEIRLVCVSADSGQLQWSVLLTFPELAADKDVIRRQWATTPVISNGVLCANTTDGWVVCVDLLTRSVLWASQM
ncbi:MAG: PQQ-binding-like beta-propeller repeat protein, partial [Planctomycetaceae bacterium]|nr:PQQ-binding-like beta-propeller repeat protein [Planctomycetaceae bacterium]